MKQLRLSPAFIALGFLSVRLALSPASGQNCSSYPATGGINLWPTGKIPVVFDPSYPESSKPTVREAMKDWMKSGGAVGFVEYSSYSAYAKSIESATPGVLKRTILRSS